MINILAILQNGVKGQGICGELLKSPFYLFDRFHCGKLGLGGTLGIDDRLKHTNLIENMYYLNIFTCGLRAMISKAKIRGVLK